MTNAHLHFPRLPPQTSPFHSPIKKTSKGLSIENAETHAIKRLQRLRKLEAKVRSANAPVRAMRGQGRVLHIHVVENQRLFRIAVVAAWEFE